MALAALHIRKIQPWYLFVGIVWKDFAVVSNGNEVVTLSDISDEIEFPKEKIAKTTKFPITYIQ